MKDILGAIFAGASFVLGIFIGYSQGWYAAETEQDADRAYVNKKMEEIGFCAWVEQAEFANHCRTTKGGGE